MRHTISTGGSGCAGLRRRGSRQRRGRLRGATPAPAGGSRRGRLRGATLVLAAGSALAVSGCGPASLTIAAKPGQIVAIGAESQYADVISQVGGRYVAVAAVVRNPNTDPHSFEASPSVAAAIGRARLIVQNGLGYDDFMNRLESASPNPGRRVISAQAVLGLPDSTANPHLWYDPKTMPAVAAALVRALSELAPSHAAYFAANARRFDRSLQPWLTTLRRFRSRHPRTPVATTEPVGNYLLRAAGTAIRTPWVLQADVMNGVDPAPQSITQQRALLTDHRVAALLYNQQVTDPLTESFLADARQGEVPVVGVYETMPAGYHYQSWMLAEARALTRAVTQHRSTTRL